MVEVVSEASAFKPRRKNLSNFSSNSLMPPTNIFQELQVERYKLNYLINCKYFKRPPQSLRVSGSNALTAQQKTLLISEFESKALVIATQNKKEAIKKLETLVLALDIDLQPFTKKQKKKYYNHYQSKIKFYRSQETTKWKDWPSKNKCTHNVDKITNRKKKIARRKANKIKLEADKLLESGDIRNLTNVDVPPEAVVVLSKGLGFIPSPSVDPEELRLDARLVTNRIISSKDNKEVANIFEKSSSVIPSKLTDPNYHPMKTPTNNKVIKQTVEYINTKVNTLENNINKAKHKNLTYNEEEGLKWLQKKTKIGEITITKADKGGSIIIVPSKYMEDKIAKKVHNQELYERLSGDPRTSVQEQLYKHWLEGKANKYVTSYEAKEIMGITENNTKSTSSKYKSGLSYFNPSLKIHKLKPEDITPGCDIPIRLILAAQDGVTKRSDVFIQQKWLNDIEKDFCLDLVSDTNATLKWLEEQNTLLTPQSKINIHPFTFDFESLYDNISPNLVREALIAASCENRPEWSNDFINWLVELCDISMQSSFGIFKDIWYKQNNGISTGSSLSVQLANITVYYVLRKCLYNKVELMDLVANNGIKRFVDDGVGLFSGSLNEFDSFCNNINIDLQKYGLNIKDDEWKISKEHNDPIHFLDIQIWFDEIGQLQTDLYIKPTDSRTYLNFNSAHPDHIFPGIVYTQSLRLRRIINNENRLSYQLNKLKEDFVRAHYPMKMLNNIIDKVKTLPRILNKQDKVSNNDKGDKINITVVSTYGRDQPLTNILENIPNKAKFKFKYVKRTAPSLRNKLCKSKYHSLGPKLGFSVKCNRNRCKSCKMMSNKNSITTKLGGKKRRIHTSSGKCTSKNVVYSVRCKCCNKNYVGRTTQTLSERTNCHRACFLKYVKSNGRCVIPTDKLDAFALGIHLFTEHNLTTKRKFDEACELYVLEVCSPRILDVKEHMWIHRLKSLAPNGLNLLNTYGLPLLP